MTTWDDRFEDFGRNALDNYRRYYQDASRPDGRDTTTEVTLAIQACMAVFVVLKENAIQVQAGTADPLKLDQSALAAAVDLVQTTFPDAASSKKPDKTTAIRNAFAHFNVRFAPASGEIEKLLLASFDKDANGKYTIPKWRGEISVVDLHKFVLDLYGMWPQRKAS
jgi:hypothetical protein